MSAQAEASDDDEDVAHDVPEAGAGKSHAPRTKRPPRITKVMKGSFKWGDICDFRLQPRSKRVLSRKVKVLKNGDNKKGNAISVELNGGPWSGDLTVAEIRKLRDWGVQDLLIVADWNENTDMPTSEPMTIRHAFPVRVTDGGKPVHDYLVQVSSSVLKALGESGKNKEPERRTTHVAVHRGPDGATIGDKVEVPRVPEEAPATTEGGKKRPAPTAPEGEDEMYKKHEKAIADLRKKHLDAIHEAVTQYTDDLISQNKEFHKKLLSATRRQ